MSSNYQPGQILTAAALNASLNAKADAANAQITGGQIGGVVYVQITGTQDSTSPEIGALQVAGGAGIQLNLQVGENITVAEDVFVNGTTASNSTTTGAIVVAGGAGIGGNANIGGSVDVSGSVSATELEATATLDSTNTTTGAIVVIGGAGIGKTLNVGGSINVGTNANITGALSVTGAATAQTVTATSTTDSTSVSTGAIVSDGGVGIAKSLNVGTNATVGGTLAVTGAASAASVTATSTTDSTSASTGAIVSDGGLGVAKTLNVGTNANITGALSVTGAATAQTVTATSTTDSTSVSTGAIVSDGGVGIAKSLNVGTNATVGGTLKASDVTLNVSGIITFGDGTTQSTAAASSAAVIGKNRIINGACRIAQRSSIACSTGIGGYGGPDRFYAANANSAGGQFTQSQGNVTYNGVALDAVVQTVNTAISSSTSTNFWSGIQQSIEGFNCFDLLGQQATLSFVFRASTAGTYSVAICDYTGNNSCVSTFSYATAGAAQAVTVSFPSIPTSLTTPNSNAGGMIVRIGAISTGTYQTSTTGSWQASNYMTASGSLNWGSAANNYISATNVKLEAGGAATAMEPNNIAAELIACQRYYEVKLQVFSPVTTGGFANDYSGYVAYASAKRTTPTVTIYSGSSLGGTSGSATWYASGSGTVATAASTANNIDGFSIQITGSSSYSLVSFSSSSAAEL
jgi:hypothetical protein